MPVSRQQWVTQRDARGNTHKCHLKEHTYQTGKEVVSYVTKTYHKTYSVKGMTHLLHRLHFVYKKTKVIPGKVNREKQEEFKQDYLELKSGK